jgi:hypothetical protein
MLEPLLAYAAPDRPVADRSMAIGCLAEVTVALGTYETQTLMFLESFFSFCAAYAGDCMLPYMPKLMPVLIAGLEDKEVANLMPFAQVLISFFLFSRRSGASATQRCLLYWCFLFSRSSSRTSLPYSKIMLTIFYACPSLPVAVWQANAFIRASGG